MSLLFAWMCMRLQFNSWSIAGVPSSQALPGFLIPAPSPVLVPAVLGALAVWIWNQKKVKLRYDLRPRRVPREFVLLTQKQTEREIEHSNGEGREGGRGGNMKSLRTPAVYMSIPNIDNVKHTSAQAGSSNRWTECRSREGGKHGYRCGCGSHWDSYSGDFASSFW